MARIRTIKPEFQNSESMGRGRPQESRRRVPSWVPADLAVIYRREAKAHSEFSAAALVRQIKRERTEARQ